MKIKLCVIDPFQSKERKRKEQDHASTIRWGGDNTFLLTSNNKGGEYIKKGGARKIGIGLWKGSARVQ